MARAHAATSNHDKRLLAAEQERILVDHRLHNVLQIRPQLLKVHHIGEMDWNQCGPPANGQVLAVHAVQLAVLRHTANVYKKIGIGKRNCASEKKSLKKFR